MSGQGRRVPFSHPFFDDPEEFWSRRYASRPMPPEFWSGSGVNRPFPSDMSYPGPYRQFPASMQAIPSAQTSHRTTSRREWSGSGPSQLSEQHFGGDICPQESFYVRKPGFERQTSGTSEIQTDDKQFKISLDVQQFTPDELDVRVVDMEVLIHAKHEQKADEHGYVSREFTRRYTLPDDINPESVKSSLSEEGMLSIEAPRQLAIKEPEGKKIPIKVETKSPAPAVEAAGAAGEDRQDKK